MRNTCCKDNAFFSNYMQQDEKKQKIVYFIISLHVPWFKLNQDYSHQILNCLKDEGIGHILIIGISH